MPKKERVDEVLRRWTTWQWKITMGSFGNDCKLQRSIL